jgi:hypothetical protein
VFLLACAAHAGPNASSKKVDAKAQAKALLDRQSAALAANNDEAIRGTFTSDAIIFVPLSPESRKVSEPGIAAGIAYAVGSSTVKKVTASNIVAGSAGSVVWFSADLDVVYSKDTDRAPRKLRAVELLDTTTGRAVTGSFGNIGRPHSAAEIGPIEGANQAGPLAKLLTSPSEAAAALSSDPAVVVLGTGKGESAVGPKKAAALLKTWSKVKFSLDGDRAREVKTKDYAYAVGYVNYPDKDPYIKNPDRMTALVIAIPDGAGWKVVAMHYGPM